MIVNIVHTDNMQGKEILNSNSAFETVAPRPEGTDSPSAEEDGRLSESVDVNQPKTDQPHEVGQPEHAREQIQRLSRFYRDGVRNHRDGVRKTLLGL